MPAPADPDTLPLRIGLTRTGTAPLAFLGGLGMTFWYHGLQSLTFHRDGVVGTKVLEAGGFFDTDRGGGLDTQRMVV